MIADSKGTHKFSPIHISYWAYQTLQYRLAYTESDLMVGGNLRIIIGRYREEPIHPMTEFIEVLQFFFGASLLYISRVGLASRL
jgi:hypothetical protein